MKGKKEWKYAHKQKNTKVNQMKYGQADEEDMFLYITNSPAIGQHLLKSYKKSTLPYFNIHHLQEIWRNTSFKSDQI